ncbi:hypothetical protein EAG11_20730 [Flavobacterium sp. 140616W15]|nr:hypothetical protein EAG11_20730 [Flavobacterium sp. 140616W15]
MKIGWSDLFEFGIKISFDCFFNVFIFKLFSGTHIDFGFNFGIKLDDYVVLGACNKYKKPFKLNGFLFVIV